MYSAGDERVYVIVSEAARNGEALRLAGLVETCDSGPTRGGSAQAQLLERLGKMAKWPDTRGSFGGLGVSDIWVERFDLTVLPREQVFRAAGAN
ncbi:MAG: hypothetical protein JJ897_11885 [Marinibacterium sp.]|nr:hypothetical protein [Marinibacterium sp.]